MPKSSDLVSDPNLNPERAGFDQSKKFHIPSNASKRQSFVDCLYDKAFTVVTLEAIPVGDKDRHRLSFDTSGKFIFRSDPVTKVFSGLHCNIVEKLNIRPNFFDLDLHN